MIKNIKSNAKINVGLNVLRKREDNYHELEMIMAPIDLYDNINITSIIRDDDIFSCLTYYEKYLLYLIEYMGLTHKQILSILKHETSESLEERIGDIYYKRKIFLEEY